MIGLRELGRLTGRWPLLRWALPALAIVALLAGSALGLFAPRESAVVDPSPVGASASERPSPERSPPAATTPSPTPTGTPTLRPTATAAPTPLPTLQATPPPPTPSPTPSFVIPQDATLDAALARCPTPDEVALVDSVLTLTFEHDPTAPDLVCTAAGGSADLTYQQERAYQAVLSMRRIPFDAPLPWTDLPLFNWFAQEVNGIIFRETELSYCCDGEGVLVIRSDTNFSNSWSDLWVGRDPNAAIGLMNGVDLLLHEARHVAGFPHTCPGGGDDATLDEGGAWAVVYWYYVWLSEHADSPYMAPVGAEPDVYIRAAANQAAATIVRIGCD